MGIFLVILLLMMVISNFLLLLIIYKDFFKCFCMLVLYFIIVLGCVDFMIGFVIEFFFVVYCLVSYLKWLLYLGWLYESLLSIGSFIFIVGFNLLFLFVFVFIWM